MSWDFIIETGNYLQGKLVHECVFGRMVKLPVHWEYQELIYLVVIISKWPSGLAFEFTNNFLLV